MKVIYKVVRVYPYGWNVDNLEYLEGMLNEGYTIVRVDKVKRKRNKDSDTFNDYILKKEETNEIH